MDTGFPKAESYEKQHNIKKHIKCKGIFEPQAQENLQKTPPPPLLRTAIPSPRVTPTGQKTFQMGWDGMWGLKGKRSLGRHKKLLLGAGKGCFVRFLGFTVPWIQAEVLKKAICSTNTHKL